MKIDFMIANHYTLIFGNDKLIFSDELVSIEKLFLLLQDEVIEFSQKYEIDYDWFDTISDFPKTLDEFKTSCSKGLTLKEFWEQ